MNQKKILKMSLTMNGLQVILIAFAIVYDLFFVKDSMSQSVYVALIGMMLLNILVSFGAYYWIDKNKKEGLKEAIKNLEDLNSTLKEQRHDYLNHIQVIYGLMELEEFEEAKKYMQPVYKDIVKVSKALKTYHPAINALLQAKLQMAEKQTIDMYLEIKSDLKYMTLEPWEMCKILSNIIDNAMRAVVMKEDSGEKEIHIIMGENMESYHIFIQNNGPMIPKELQHKVFEEGFTTKKEEGHGMGLAIVKRTLKDIQGDIKLLSTHEKTTFEIYLPKYNKEK